MPRYAKCTTIAIIMPISVTNSLVKTNHNVRMTAMAAILSIRETNIRTIVISLFFCGIKGISITQTLMRHSHTLSITEKIENAIKMTTNTPHLHMKVLLLF